MENNTENKNGTCCKVKNDVRTFLIALLTSVIVVAVYHFGTGCCSIMKGTYGPGCAPMEQRFVLVPVAALPCPMMQGCPNMRGPGNDAFQGRRNGRRNSDFRRRGEKEPDMFRRSGESVTKEERAPGQKADPNKGPIPAPED